MTQQTEERGKIAYWITGLFDSYGISLSPIAIPIDPDMLEQAVFFLRGLSSVYAFRIRKREIIQQEYDKNLGYYVVRTVDYSMQTHRRTPLGWTIFDSLDIERRCPGVIQASERKKIDEFRGNMP